MEFIGRNEELKRLKEAYASAEYEGILLYGRRRIGKSELLKQSIKGEDCRAVYFECTKVSEQSNTEAFSDLIGKAFGIPTPYFRSFASAMEYLFEKSVNEKIIVVIDEYPYLREKIAECDSVFQKVIDTYAMNCKMKLVLCGSYVDIMEKLMSEGNPLHKRICFNINLHQMDYYESARFYPNYSNEDKVKIYAVFGGIPYYNRFVDDTKTVEENIISLIASQGARFERDPELTLETELSKMTNANEVFLAIARGNAKFSDILNASKVSSSPALVDTLKKLTSMDIIKKEHPINDETEKKSYYVISDRLSKFYYKYIFPRASYFSVMPAIAFYEEFIATDFEEQFVPHEFEEIAKQYLIRKNKAGMLSPTLYKVGKYYYDDAKNKRNGEFDVVTLDKKGYTFYEVKFTKKPIDDGVVREEKTQLSNVGIEPYRLGFVSKSGFNLSNSEDFHLISIDEMYAE